MVMSVFSESFVQKQREIFSAASKKAGEQEQLLNPNKTNEILKYLEELKTDQRNNDQQQERSYYGLLKLITETKDDFNQKMSGCFIHPFAEALDTVKANIISAINAAHPNLQEEYATLLLQKQNAINSARKGRAADLLGCISCCFWTVPQKVITCGDSCVDFCDTRDTPYLENGEVACCSPVTSMESVIDDFTNLGSKIDDLKPQIRNMQR